MAASLHRILRTLGDQVVEVLTAPDGLGVEVTDVVILDPDDPPAAQPGALILVIGARGRTAVPALRAAARGGAVAVAVKSGIGLSETAADAGVALLSVRPEARWEHVEALIRGVVEAARAAGEAETGEVLGDLFALAQATATLTGGPVTIEDTANRVLAYSRAGDDVDELRRLSILGRQGPERYLSMLRKWGVYQRLRVGEGVVDVAERPEFGLRRRLAAGIHAGSRHLGVIWVQEGTTPLTAQAENALLGASRALAPQLIRLRSQTGPDVRLRDELLAGLLEGRLDAASIAGDIGADPTRPAVVAAFTVGGGQGSTPRQLLRGQLANLISVHAAAYRRGALVSVLDGRVYALLPDLTEGAEPTILEVAREVVGVARRHLDVSVHAALGGVVRRLSDVRTSRSDADRVLDAMARGGWADGVASLADVRPQVILSEILAFLGERPSFRDPRITELSDYDARHGRILIPAVLAYLDAFGDIRRAADNLNVHPNTVRYRIRRAEQVSGLRLDDPELRLLTELQLRL